MHNILIVDDSSTIRKAAEIAFRFEPFTLHMAEGKESAESIIAEIELDAALIDVGLPEEDSANLCQTLHSKFGDRLKIILLSPKNAPLAPKELEELCALAQVGKPFQTQVLIDQTRKSLDLKIEKSVATVRFGGVAQDPEALGQAVFAEEEKFSVTTPPTTETSELSLADIQKGSEIVSPPPTPITVPKSLAPKIIYSPPPAAALNKESDTEREEASFETVDESLSEPLAEDNDDARLSPPIMSQQYTEPLGDTLGEAEIAQEPLATTAAPSLSDVDIHGDITSFQTEDPEVFGEAEEAPASPPTTIATDLPEEEANIPFAPPPISVTESSDEKPFTPPTAITSDFSDDNAGIPFAPAPVLAPDLPSNDSGTGPNTVEKLAPFKPITDLMNGLLDRALEPSHDQPLLPELDEEQLMPLVEAAVRKIAQESIESVVWEVVPQICELIIQERLSEINPGLDALR